MFKKIGPVIAILSGLVTLVFAVMVILATKNIISDQSWLKGFKEGTINTSKRFNQENATVYWMFGITAGIGFLTFAIGIFAFMNSGGIAAFIILALIVAQMVFTIIGGVKQNYFSTATIIILSVQGIASAAMLSGLIIRR